MNQEEAGAAGHELGEMWGKVGQRTRIRRICGWQTQACCEMTFHEKLMK